MNANFKKLHDLLLNCSNSFNIICVTETWCTNNDIKNNSNFHLPNFDFVHQERNTGKKGWQSNICKESNKIQNNERPFCF